MSQRFDEEYALVGRLLRVWTRPDRTNTQPQGTAAIARRRFTPVLNQEAIGPALKHNEHTNDAGWLLGAPIRAASDLFPVATVSTDETGESLRLTMRVALFHESRKRTEGVLGWRFESPDLPTDHNRSPAHPYNHAQSIVGWRLDLRCLLHPHTSDLGRSAACSDDHYNAVDEERPAFPLRGRSAPGLVLAAILAMAGEPVTRKLLSYDRQILSSSFGPEFRDILGI